MTAATPRDDRDGRDEELSIAHTPRKDDDHIISIRKATRHETRFYFSQIPADDKFFACAVALKASVIVTGDKAMLRVANYMGIAVESPEQFLSSRPVRK